MDITLDSGSRDESSILPMRIERILDNSQNALSAGISVLWAFLFFLETLGMSILTYPRTWYKNRYQYATTMWDVPSWECLFCCLNIGWSYCDFNGVTSIVSHDTQYCHVVCWTNDARRWVYYISINNQLTWCVTFNFIMTGYKQKEHPLNCECSFYHL